jgi:hypothetical protein
MNQQWQTATRLLARAILSGEPFETSQMTVEVARAALAEYPHSCALPPEGEQYADGAFDMPTESELGWSVLRFGHEDGTEGDLSIEATICRRLDGSVYAVLDDIHVM